jgi:hypothetical protein
MTAGNYARRRCINVLSVAIGYAIPGYRTNPSTAVK